MKITHTNSHVTLTVQVLQKPCITFLAVNLGIILKFIAHVIFALSPNYSYIPYLATSLMGIAYSMVAVVIWPLIALIVPVHQLGTAYGV